MFDYHYFFSFKKAYFYAKAPHCYFSGHGAQVSSSEVSSHGDPSSIIPICNRNKKNQTKHYSQHFEKKQNKKQDETLHQTAHHQNALPKKNNFRFLTTG